MDNMTELGLSSLDVDPNAFPSELPQKMSSSLEEAFVQPAYAQVERDNQALSKWRRDQLDRVHSSVMDLNSFSSGSSDQAKKRKIIMGLIDVHLDRKPESVSDYRVARGVLAKKFYDGAGADNDDSLFEQIKKESESRQKQADLHKDLQESAFKSSLGVGDFAEWASTQSGMSEPRKQSLLPYWNQYQEQVNEQYGDVLPHANRTTDLFLSEGIGEALDYVSTVTMGMEPDEIETFMGLTREKLMLRPSDEVYGLMQALGVNPKITQAMANVQGAARVVGNVAREIPTGIQDLGTQLVNLVGDEQDVALRESLIRNRDTVKEFRRIMSDEWNPSRPFFDGGTLGAVESGIYAMPSVALTSLTALIPVVGMPMTGSMLYGSMKQEYKDRFIADGMSREDADSRAQVMAGILTAPNLAMEKFQSLGWKGRLPFFDKLFAKVNNKVNSKLARGIIKATGGGAVEAFVEMQQDLNVELLQAYASAWSDEIPEVDWHNGKDGVFDGYFNKFLSAWVAVSPMMTSLGISGVQKSHKADALKMAPREVRTMAGINDKDNDLLESATTEAEKEAAVDRIERNINPDSDQAIDAIHEYMEKESAAGDAMKRMIESGQFPILRMSKENPDIVDIYDPANNQLIDRVEGHIAATEAMFSYLGMQERVSQARFDELSGLIEAGILDVKKAVDQKAKVELDPFTEMGVQTLLEQYPEFADRAIGQVDRLNALKDKEILAGGNGQISELVYGVSIPQHEADQTSYLQRLWGGSSAMTLVHERGHVFRKQAIRRGTLTNKETYEFFSNLDKSLEGKKSRKGESIRFLPKGTKETDELALDEAVAEFAEVLLLRTKGGKKSQMREVVGRQLSAMVKANVPAASKFKAFYDAMLAFFDKLLARHYYIKKAIRDGLIDESQIEDFRARLQGTTEQEQFDADVDRMVGEMAGDTNIPFSIAPDGAYKEGGWWYHSTDSVIGEEGLQRYGDDGSDQGGIFFSDDSRQGKIYSAGYGANMYRANIQIDEEDVFNLGNPQHLKRVEPVELYDAVGKDFVRNAVESAREGTLDWTAIEPDLLEAAGFKGAILYERPSGMYGQEPVRSLVIFNPEDISNFEPVPESEAKQIREDYTSEVLKPSFSISKEDLTLLDKLDIYDGQNFQLTHNLDISNLKRVDELGGLPNPSMALTRPSHAPSSFGDISLVGNRALVDEGRADIYPADAWSPRMPEMIFKAPSIKDSDEFFSRFADASKRFDQSSSSLWDWVSRNNPNREKAQHELENKGYAKVVFLKEVHGINVEPKRVTKAHLLKTSAAGWLMKDKQFVSDIKGLNLSNIDYDSPDRTTLGQAINDSIDRLDIGDRLKDARRSNWLEDGVIKFSKIDELDRSIKLINRKERPVDSSATRKRIDRAIKGKESEFLDWVKSELDDLFPETFLMLKGRKVPYTLENAFEQMNTQRQQAGSEGTLTFGAGKAKAVSSKKYKSIDDARKDIETIIEPESLAEWYETKQEPYLGEYRTLVSEYTDQGSWDAMDSSMKVLADYLKGIPMESAMVRHGFENVPDNIIQKAKGAAELIRKSPTEYFEAKGRDIFRLSEFSGIVAPRKQMADVKPIAEKHGLIVRYYNPMKVGDRARAIGSLKKVKPEISFSIGDARIKTTLAAEAMRRAKDPEALAATMMRIAGNLESLKRDVPKIIKAFGKEVEQKVVVDKATKTDLRKQAALKKKMLIEEAENEVYRRYGEILSNEDLVKLSSQPITEFIIAEGGFESLTAAVKRTGSDETLGGEFESIAGLPPIYYGGGQTPDQMALQLYNENMISENSVEDMVNAIDREIQSVSNRKEELKEAKRLLSVARSRAAIESQEWLEERLGEQKRDQSPMQRAKRALAMLEAIRKSIPMELRGKIGGDMKLLTIGTDEKRLEYLTEKLDKAEKVVTKWIVSNTKKEIIKLFDVAKVRMDSKGIPKGLLVADYKERIDNIQAMSKMTKDQVDDKLQELGNRIESTENQAEIDAITIEMAELMAFGSIDTMQPAQLVSFMENLSSVVAEGRTLRKIKDEEHKRKMDNIISLVNNDVTGGGGRMTSSEAKRRKKKREYLSKLDKFHKQNLSFEWIMNSLSRDNKAVGTMEGATHKRLSTKVHIATHQEKRANMSSMEEYNNFMSDLLGVSGIRLSKKIHKEFMEEQEDTGVYRIDYLGLGESVTKTMKASNVDAIMAGADAKSLGLNQDEVRSAIESYNAIKSKLQEKENESARKANREPRVVRVPKNRNISYQSPNVGKKEQLMLSQSQAINLTMLFRQEGLKESMISEGYTEEVMAQIEGFLTDNSKAVRDWLTEKYDDNYNVINAVFRDQNGVNLPKIEFYSPARRKAGDEKDVGLALDSAGNKAMSTNPRFLTSRTKNFAEMDQNADALSLYMQHVYHTNHYVAWAETVRELRTVFGNKDVKQNISDYHGKETLQIINERVQWFADGGNRNALHLRWLDNIRIAHTYSSLSYNWGLMLKQFTSLPAYGFDMPLSDYVKYQSRFFADPVKHWNEMIKTEYVRTRFKEGYDRDVVEGLKRDGGYITKTLQSGMIFTKAGDIVPVIVGGWAAKQRAYDMAIANGASKKEAEFRSVIAFEMASDRAQQASDLKDYSSFQGGGSAFKLFTMYKTSLRQYYANVYESLLDFTAGKKGAGAEFARRFTIGQIILPLTFQFVSDAILSMTSGEDEFEPEDYVRAVLLGPLNGLFVVGDFAETIATGIADAKVWLEKFPAFEGASSIGFALKNLHDGDIEDAAQGLIEGMGKISPNIFTFYDILARRIGQFID